MSNTTKTIKIKAVLQFTPDEAKAESQRKEDMTNLMKIEQNLTMSTREIAELTNKEHSNVMRDVRNMLEALSMDSELKACAKSSTYTGKDGRSYNQYELDKDTCLTLLLGYDAVARMKVVKRWQELEAKAQKPMTQIEVLLASVQMLADVEKRLVATEQQSKEVQGAVAKHESKFIDIESGLEDVKNTNILDHCPTHAESITAIRDRMNKLYGLSMKVVDEVMRQSPLSLKPAHTVRNTNPAAKGSSYFVYHVKDVNKVFALFASQAEMVSVGRYKHPFIEGNFKMNK